MMTVMIEYDGGIDPEVDEALNSVAEKHGVTCHGAGCCLIGAQSRDMEFGDFSEPDKAEDFIKEVKGLLADRAEEWAVWMNRRSECL